MINNYKNGGGSPLIKSSNYGKASPQKTNVSNSIGHSTNNHSNIIIAPVQPNSSNRFNITNHNQLMLNYLS
jgi:hypothetical protein